MNYRSCMSELASKVGKITKSGQNMEGVSVHEQ